eukprot:gene2655-5211_t
MYKRTFLRHEIYGIYGFSPERSVSSFLWAMKFGIYWFLIPAVNFTVWFMIGRTEHPEGYFDNEICPTPPPIIVEPPPCLKKSTSLKSSANTARLSHSKSISKLPVHECGSLILNPSPVLKSVNAEKLSEYRNEDLVEMKYPGWTTLVNAHDADCESFVNPSLGRARDCIAVVHANTRAAHPLLRYDSAAKWKGLVTKTGQHFPTGFFRRTGNKKGRARITEKMGPLFVQLQDVEMLLQDTFEKQGVKRGDDVVVMVTNAGEMDLFLNFACSCRSHNMSLTNMIVFTGS